MTTDPQDWFLTSQALDHHATVEALEQAINSTGTPVSGLAEPVATELACAGFVLVQVRPLDSAVTAMDIDVPGFLTRKQD